MGNGIGKLTVCFTGNRRQNDTSVFYSDPLDEGLGHSFVYIRPDPTRLQSNKVHASSEHDEKTTTTFRTISGASVSANTSTPPLSTSIVSDSYYSFDKAASFESSNSFASIPLQPVPRGGCSGPMSGPVEGLGFMSGPIERGIFSGPIEKDQFQRSFSGHDFNFDLNFRRRSRNGDLIRSLRRVIWKTMVSFKNSNSVVARISDSKEKHNNQIENNLTISSLNFSDGSLDDDELSSESRNLQWAQGKAGEDRLHVVVSEENGWVFVGIYDGFNGPDAPDFLLSSLYPAVHKELKGLLWDDDKEFKSVNGIGSENNDEVCVSIVEPCLCSVEQEDYPCSTRSVNSDAKCNKRSRSKYRGATTKREENQRKWRCQWDRERQELDRRLKEQLNKNGTGVNGSRFSNHGDVLKALSRALKKTEEAYLDIADKMLMHNPELSLMGSCVLVMLMKGEDVYVMNVGDSRAVIGQKAEPDHWLGQIKQDLERINEESLHDLEGSNGDRPNCLNILNAFQLSSDHSTSVKQEVQRIRNEHPDDACAVMNDRVKGSLKVTRAFGAGFLKKPKWNNSLLEMFRIDYVGNSPYISCLPSLYHHRLGPTDRFLILSSDGLYQYFTNEEAVSEVELFIALQPEGDPAQHLVEELLFRAAKKAGIDFHDLLEIPPGDRRRYHDDISIIVISLEGRIWRSCV